MPPASGRTCFVASALLPLLFAFAPLASAADNPATPASQPAADAAWGSDEAGSSGRSPVIRDSVNRDSSVTIGPPNCPVCVVGNQVYELKSSKPLAVIGHRYGADEALAMSPDGKLFAASIEPLAQEPATQPASTNPFNTTPAPARNNRRPRPETPDDPRAALATVTVWSLETGAKVSQIPAIPVRDLQLMAFGPDHRLILGGNDPDSSGVCKVFDAKSAQKIGTLAIGKMWKRYASSPDGRYLAVAGQDALIVYNVVSGNRVLTMRPPVIEEPPQPAPTPAVPAANPKIASPPPPPRPGVSSTPRPPHEPNAPVAPQLQRPDPEFEMAFIIAWTEGLRFSPDGKELALVSSHPNPYLFVWDQKGDCTFQTPIHSDRFGFHGGDLTWLPDGAGWFVASQIIDRKSKREVFRIPAEFSFNPVACFLDRDHVLTTVGHNDSIETVTIPWDRIQKSLADLYSKNPANFRPGQAVSIRVDVQNPRGDLAQTRDKLYQALALRLAKDDLKVADNQSSFFKITLTEKSGQVLHIFDRGRNPFERIDTGRTVPQALGDTVIELFVQGQDKPVWSTRLSAESAPVALGQISAQQMREAMIESTFNQFDRIQFPYFRPRTPGIDPLPIIANVQ